MLQYHTHRHLWMTVQYTILHSMNLNCECMLTKTYDVLGELDRTRSQIKVMECNTLTVMNSNHFANQGLLLLITVAQNGLDQKISFAHLQIMMGVLEPMYPLCPGHLHWDQINCPWWNIKTMLKINLAQK